MRVINNNCFRALGLDPSMATAEDVKNAYEFRASVHKSNTESDRLNRQLLRENRDLCLAALGEATE